MRSLHMKNTVFVLILASLIPSPLLTSVGAEDWSQFRGPNGTGVSTSTGLPEEFGLNKNVVWKTALPPGHSSPVLTRNRIFVTAYSKQNANSQQQTANSKEQTNASEKKTYKLLVICLDRQTGKLLWQREVPRSKQGRLQNVNGPASPSPSPTAGTSLLSRVWVGFLQRRRQGKVAAPARTVQHVLRLRGITNPRRRQSSPARRSRQSEFIPDSGR